jgi:hypothetical protein
MLAEMHAKRPDFPTGAMEMCAVGFDEMIIIRDVHIKMANLTVVGFSDRLTLSHLTKLVLKEIYLGVKPESNPPPAIGAVRSAPQAVVATTLSSSAASTAIALTKQAAPSSSSDFSSASASLSSAAATSLGSTTGATSSSVLLSSSSSASQELAAKKQKKTTNATSLFVAATKGDAPSSSSIEALPIASTGATPTSTVRKWIDVTKGEQFDWEVVHGYDGKEGQESLEPSTEPDLSKHYLLVKTVNPNGYAARVLGISSGDKVYGMTKPSTVRGKPPNKDTRVSNSDILQHIKDSYAAGQRDKEAQKVKAAATRAATKATVSITNIPFYRTAILLFDMNILFYHITYIHHIRRKLLWPQPKPPAPMVRPQR